MANQKSKKGSRPVKRGNNSNGGGRPYRMTTRTTDEVRTGMGGMRASVRPTSNGLIIKNSGIMGVYPTDTGARATAFGINPADAQQFPWLNNIVRCYGQYRWKKLRLLWQSTTGTGVSGDINMGVVYDLEEVRVFTAVLSGATARMQAVASSRDVMSGPVWGSRCQTVNGRMTADIMTDVDISRAHSRFNWFLVNQYKAGTTETAEDNMAVGIYLIGHLGSNGSFVGNAGVLWVDYEIEVTGPVSASLQPIIPPLLRSQETTWPPVYPDSDLPPPPWIGEGVPGGGVLPRFGQLSLDKEDVDREVQA